MATMLWIDSKKVVVVLGTLGLFIIRFFHIVLFGKGSFVESRSQNFVQDTPSSCRLPPFSGIVSVAVKTKEKERVPDQ